MIQLLLQAPADKKYMFANVQTSVVTLLNLSTILKK